MTQQNVTISLPTTLLRKARHLAVDQGVSLSRYVALLLEERVEADEVYQAASRRQRKMMREGWDLGSQGNITWDRSELHER